MSRSTLGTESISYRSSHSWHLFHVAVEENPDVSSPVLGLGVLVLLLVVAVTLDFGGQSRMSHLRVIAHRFDADHLAFVFLIVFPVLDLQGGSVLAPLGKTPDFLQTFLTAHLQMHSHHLRGLSWL